MGTSDMTEADWEEYYRNVNVFNIPNADDKRVEIWDKAFLSTKTVRETLWEVYSKGFMDGVNDTSERFKSSAYKQKYDADLLDKVAYELKETFNNECPMNYTSTQPFFTLENVRTLIDMVIKEIKVEVE